jgi:ABC-type amino acid transport substrate-binding protein
MNEAKKRGRPAKANGLEAQTDLPTSTRGCPDFMATIERYLKLADWTKGEFMAAIELAETQIYRWKNGTSNIRKATVNRMAVQLATRLDEVYARTHGNFHRATDDIDSLLNELLDAAGFAGSVKGRSKDYCWNRITSTKSWKLGFTDVPEWAIRNDEDGNQSIKPTGKAIEYAENIGRLLGLTTEWEYLKFDTMPEAIRQRRVDGIAPLMVALPGRLFDFSFSASCADSHKFTLTAISDRELVNGAKSLEELPQNKVELIYLKGELGDWGRQILSQYECKGFSDTEQAIQYMQGVIERGKSIIPVLLIDNATGNFLIDDKKSLSLVEIEIQRVNMESFNAFAFNPDEKRLLEAVNQAISVFPIYLEPDKSSQSKLNHKNTMSSNSSINYSINTIMDREKSMIAELGIKDILDSVINEGRIVKFSEAFHFIRHEFCRLNFIVGARCPNDERMWAGLAKNLIEELGGKHNQLYRDFLKCIYARSEEKLECPKFAQEFNDTWKNFAHTAPLNEALSAIAIYEIFDIPDYRLFLEVLEQAKVPESGLTFFRVHANAHHFEMFEDTVEWILQQEGGQEAFDKATEFVFETQRKMWIGLTECLQSKQLVTAN